MTKAYKNMKSTLIEIDFKFNDENIDKDISLETSEEINIKSITDSSISLSVERKLMFNGLKDTYLKVKYDVIIGLNEKITITRFEKDIKSGVPILSGVFSDISLIMAQVTDKSLFGAIISPPMYNKNRIQIK